MQAKLIYPNLEKDAQAPLEIFSWQTFVVFDWPANEASVPIGEPIGARPNLPRVSQSHKQPDEVFGLDGEDLPWRSDAISAIATDMNLQSSGKPLIDRNLNHVVFEARMKGRTEQYIVSSGFDPVQGQ